MVWKNYYRPKQQDPYSLTALERLNEKELLVKKKYFEKTIKEIEEVLDKSKYKSYLENISEEKILQKNKEIKDKFNKIKKHIKISIKYYARRSFFGSLKDGKILCNVTCDDNDDTRYFLNEFKLYINSIFKLAKLSDKNNAYNIKISSFVNSQISKDKIKNIKRIYEHDVKSLNFINYYILDEIHTGLIDINGENIGLGHYSTFQRDSVEQPSKSKDAYWLNSYECEKNEFKKIDGVDGYFNEDKGLRYASKKINICGKFFKEMKNISNKIEFYDLKVPYEEDFFLNLREELLKHYNTYLRKIILINRSKIRKDSLEKSFNNVYVLSNKSYEGIFKVGWTSNLPEERADQLSSETGVLYPFKVVYSKEFKNAEKIEKKIHSVFKKNRLRGNKEFFKIDKEKLIDYIKSIDE